MSIRCKLHTLQKELKAPKNQYNSFGMYKYRNCEDILEAVKSELPDGCTISVSDEIINVGDRYYIKATALLSDEEGSISTTGLAREAADKKGMDSAQVTGAASSYARKYALSGLFAIDDTKDSDTDEHKHNADAGNKKANLELIKLYEKISMDMLNYDDKDEFKAWWLGTKQDRAKLDMPQQQQLISKMNKEAEKWRK